MIRYLSFFTACILSCIGFGVYAEEAFLDSIVSIGEVTVTEKKINEIIPAQKLDGETLEKLNSYSVADAIRYFSGVQIKDYGGMGGIKTINIRSLGTHNVGVFYDGIQLGNAQNGQVDLGRYSLDNIEEITLYNGQKSEIFQSAKDFGSSGTLYIKTRKPRFSGSERYRLTAQFKTGSFGLANPSLIWEQKLTNFINFSASAEYMYANGRYKFRYRRVKPDGNVAYDTTAIRENSDISAFRGEIGVYGYTMRGTWNVKGYFYDSERGLPGAIVNNVFKRGERQWDRNIFVQGSYRAAYSPLWEMMVNLKYANDYTRFLRDDKKELYIDNRYYQQEAYISWANLFKVNPWWSFSASADFQWNKLNSDMHNFTYPTRWTEMLSLASAFYYGGLSAQVSILGHFIQDYTANKNASPEFSGKKHQFSPAFFLGYRCNRYLKLNAFIKRSFRMPTFNDMYYTEVGSTALNPEKTFQCNAGMDYRRKLNHSFFDEIGMQADVYYNYVNDKIVAYPTGQQFRWTMLNLGKVRIYGAEIGADVSAHIGSVNIAVRLNYTYQSAGDYTDPEDSYYGDQIPYIPWHSGSATGHLAYRGWNLNYSFIYTGERYNAQENIPSNYEQPWYTTDLSLVKDFKIRKVQCRVAGEVNNLFNQYYDIVINFPMPGRNYKLTLKIMI